MDKKSSLFQVIQKILSVFDLNINRVRFYKFLGKYLQLRGNLDAAIVTYSKILAVDPEFLSIYDKLGELYRLQENPKRVALQYKLLGQSLHNRGNLDGAISSYLKALYFDSDLTDAYDQLGKLYEAQNNQQDAILQYRKVLSLENSNYEARIKLIQLLRQQAKQFERDIRDLDNNSKAIQCWQNIIDLTETNAPEAIEATVHIGRALRVQGKFIEGMKWMQKFVELQNQRIDNHPLAHLNIRFLENAHTIQIIGHTAHLDPQIKIGILGWRPNHKLILLAPTNKIINPCYLSYWQQYISIIYDSELIRDLTPVANHLTLSEVFLSLPQKQQAATTAHAWPAIQKEWDSQRREPLLTLLQEDCERGWGYLENFGISRNNWFVSLHVREGGFYREKNSYSSYRNADIDTYILAIESIVARGGWVIRMGDPTMKPLPSMERVIDYAISDLKSDWMDVFLWAKCRFFLGTNSGPYDIPATFGVPRICTNHPPTILMPYGSQDLFISKLIWSNQKERYLSFQEVHSFPIFETYNSILYDRWGLQFQDNTPEEINEVVLEMLDRLEKKIEYTPEDERLQQEYAACVPELVYNFSHPRMGRDFLRRHAHLIRSP